MNNRAQELKSKIAAKERLILDGAMGTELIKFPEYSAKDASLINLTHPEIVTAVHKSYVDAGSNLIIANCFDVNRDKYENYEEVIAAAVKNARAATEGHDDCYVGLDIGPIGKLMYPMGLLRPEEAYDIFCDSVRCGVANDVDFVIIETMIDESETREALRAVKDNCDLPVIVSSSYNQRGRLLTTGARPADVIAIAEELGADAIGTNCSFGPDKMLPVIKALAEGTDLPIWAKPNAGQPEVIDGKTVYSIGLTEFLEYMKEIIDCGATLIGGCCGTSPEYIKAIKEL